MIAPLKKMFHVTPSLNLSTLRFRWVVASVAASSDVWAVVKSPIRQTRAKKLLECLPLRITSLHYRGKVPLMFAQPLLISFFWFEGSVCASKKAVSFFLTMHPSFRIPQQIFPHFWFFGRSASSSLHFSFTDYLDVLFQYTRKSRNILSCDLGCFMRFIR